MKKLTLLIFIIFFALNVFSQNYIAKYQNFADSSCDSVFLMFNATDWLYLEYHTFSSGEIQSDDVDVSEIPELQNIKSLLHNAFFSYHSLQENQYMKEDGVIGTGKVVIKSSMNRLDWMILSDSTKLVGSYQCLMATADLCGISVQAWFAPEIPVICGPDRFWGLPGLIVSVKSADGSIFLELLSLSKTENKIIKPQVVKTFTKEQFWEIKADGEAKLIRKFASMSNEHSKYSVSIPPTTDREKCLFE